MSRSVVGVWRLRKSRACGSLHSTEQGVKAENRLALVDFVGKTGVGWVQNVKGMGASEHELVVAHVENPCGTAGTHGS